MKLLGQKIRKEYVENISLTGNIDGRINRSNAETPDKLL